MSGPIKIMNQTIKEIGKKIVSLVPTKLWLSYRFKQRTGYKMDWENPKTFNQKLQWLKLYNRKPIFTTMVDKYEAKKYVANIIGEEHIIPTIGVWNRFDDIDFDILPDQFVLKCTHDSGGLVIVRDKSKFDKEAARKQFKIALGRTPYDVSREWPYKNVTPRIIAEKLITEISNPDGLVEYKIFCFNGEPKIVLVCKGQAHAEGRTNDYCDLHLQRLPFTALYPNSKGELPMPQEMPEILEIAKKLSVGIPQLRVDTYVADGRIYFGELTFFHNSGMVPFTPPEWDQKLGDWIQLPEGSNK